MNKDVFERMERAKALLWGVYASDQAVARARKILDDKPGTLCDELDCWNEPTHHVSGGFHFCDEHGGAR